MCAYWYRAPADVPLAAWAANAVYARLLDAGIRIFEYLPGMLHAKVVIVDGKRATLGTANLDYRSLFQNYELNLVSEDPDLCSPVRRRSDRGRSSVRHRLAATPLDTAPGRAAGVGRQAVVVKLCKSGGGALLEKEPSR